MKTIILGMGNTIMSDDGVGIRVSRILKDMFSEYPDIEVRETPLAGLNIILLLEGYDRAYIIDAIKTRDGTPGKESVR